MYILYIYIYIYNIKCYHLFNRCWQKAPEERPSMDEVVRIMTELSEFFSSHLEPVEYSLSTHNMYLIYDLHSYYLSRVLNIAENKLSCKIKYRAKILKCACCR